MAVANVRGVNTTSTMRKPRNLLVVIAAAYAASASGQTLYRCDDGGRVTYTDRACATGAVRHIQPEAGSPAEERRLAAARLREAIAEFNARHAVNAPGALSPQLATAQGGPPRGASAPPDSAPWCETRRGESESTVPVGAVANVLVSTPRRN